MATFSTNQVRQLYVVKGATGEGSIAVKSNDEHVYFAYKGADEQPMRSDLIDKKNILYAKRTAADKMQRNLKSVKVTLNDEVNGGLPVAGQDYILRVAFKQFIGISDEDMYFKYGMVHAHAGMTTAAAFYKVLAISLAKNFSREASPLVKIETTIATAKTEVLPTMKVEDIAGEVDGVIITEVEQPWRLGVMKETKVDFTVQDSTITVDGDEVLWAKITPEEGAVIGNGKTIADMEYFYMGERGDQYRNIGWPNSFATKYLVDPKQTYDVIDIHYAYVGENQYVQKSEKDITIVGPAAEITSVVTALTDAGVTVAQ